MNQIFLICHQKSNLENQITTERVFIVFLHEQNPLFMHVSSVLIIWIQQNAIVYIQQVLLGDNDPNSY